MQKPKAQLRWVAICAGLFVVLIVLLCLRRESGAGSNGRMASSTARDSNALEQSQAARSARFFRRASTSPDAAAVTAEDIVARKLVQFGKSRRELVESLGKEFKVKGPGAGGES